MKRESQWADHLEILDKLAALKDDESQVGERLMLWLQAARVTEEKIQESDAAIRRYEQILTFEPARRSERWRRCWEQYQADAKLALERLVQSERRRGMPPPLCWSRCIASTGEWRPLIELFELKLACGG
jgi:hypothetical protein